MENLLDLMKMDLWLINNNRPTSGFTGPHIVCDYCYDASPQNPSRYASSDPWRWADPNDPHINKYVLLLGRPENQNVTIFINLL